LSPLVDVVPVVDWFEDESAAREDFDVNELLDVAGWFDDVLGSPDDVDVLTGCDGKSVGLRWAAFTCSESEIGEMNGDFDR